jgi:pyridinium-3,5-biscarboxylic acid mononucleotide sulfurtransferase
MELHNNNSFDISSKFNNLIDYVKSFKKAAIAFSGGVDSSFLAKVCHDVLKDNCIAITIYSPFLPKSELDDAKALANSIGIKHFVINDTLIDDIVSKNPVDRCFFCKKIEFSTILKIAHENGIDTVFDGSNLDDLSDYRPGLNALKELNINSPLREAGLTKIEIRALSKNLGLKTWDKPAYACLASRIPYGENITIEKLSQVEKAEEYLKQKGFRQFRVRNHGEIARIEIAPLERTKIFDTELIDEISRTIKSFGFIFVCMELEGYKTGNLNSTIQNKI